MAGLKPVTISNSAFNFCKYTIAIMLWTSLLLKNEILVGIAFAILLISAIVKVEKAPLILLYHNILDKILKYKEIVVEENSICFAHTFGAIIAAVALLLMQFVNPMAGWITVGVLAFLKSIASFGFCGAAKLYTCLNNPNGKCCRGGLFAKKCIR